jgi:hypothetical protein
MAEGACGFSALERLHDDWHFAAADRPLQLPCRASIFISHDNPFLS